MMVLSALLVLVPFIPGIRSLPRWIPIHRLVWRDYYRRYPKVAGPESAVAVPQPHGASAQAPDKTKTGA